MMLNQHGLRPQGARCSFIAPDHWDGKGHKINLMNYNQLNFYHRNPFYKQDFLPDRAWYNRESKAYPSEIPSGKDFLPDTGRKHYKGKFNHSQIEEDSVLRSPERYPFENRIALDKTYMRSLNTIDIEGASSNTRVNQSIKNKHKARESLARRYNQSLDLAQKTQEDRRKEVALQQYSSYKQKQSRIVNEASQKHNNGSNRPNNPEKRQAPSLTKDITDQYKRYVMQNSSNKFHKDIPIVSSTPKILKSYSTMQPSGDSKQRGQGSQNMAGPQYIDRNRCLPVQQSERLSSKAQNQGNSPSLNNYSRYQNEFNAERLKHNEQYKKILQYEQLQRRMLKNPKQVRKVNPTNLSMSFNLAGQSIVSG